MPSKLSRTMNQADRPDRLLPAVRALLAGAAIAACAAGFSGCEKKKPPPPPVQPPPPPPPAPLPVTISTLMQDLGADSRVQFASNVEIIEEPFAKAVIHLADGLAKGDSNKLKPMLTSTAKAVLDDLQSSGDWSDQTKKIEAVRVVYAGSPPSASEPAIDPSQPLPTNPDDMKAMAEQMAKGMAGAMADAIQKMTPEQRRQLIEALPVAPGTDPEKAKQMKDEALKALDDPEAMKKAMEAMKAFAGDAAAAAPLGGDFKPEKAVVFAVQDPSGAYLLAWFGKAEGEESYVFSNAPSAGMSKRRASEFDGIGLAAITARDAVTFTHAAGKPADAPADGKPADAKPSTTTPPLAPDQPDRPAPIKRNTPNGPITIPGARASHSQP